MKSRLKGAFGYAAGALFAGVIVLAGGVAPSAAQTNCPHGQTLVVQIGDRHWRVGVAASPEERMRGLSGRPGLATGQGMWFVLPAPGNQGFWMKDMAFAIDLAWIAASGRVVGVETLAPCGQPPCPIAYPPEPVAFVLEVPADSVPRQEADMARWHCSPD